MDDETRDGDRMPARALHYLAPRHAAIQPVALNIDDGSHVASISLRTTFTGLSRGTERLVFEGKLPQSEWQRMRAPHQEGDFPFPVKYGYSAVGVVESGPEDLVGRSAFGLFPHQDQIVARSDDVVALPEGVPPRRAVLAANMETALNGVWDSGVSAGHNVLIIGGGVLGALVAAIVGRMPGVRVGLVDVRADRADLAHTLGADFFAPQNAPGGADIVFHTSASEAGLRLALTCAGFEGRIVELSWYGDRDVSLPLGEAFHSQRLQLISSQVGHVAPSHRPRWTHRDRLEKALALLDDPRLDALITEEVAFDDLPDELPRLLAPDAPGLATVIRYPQA
jgi:NADPH:quinone reductase-like Zn-dependent oxidoreductase